MEEALRDATLCHSIINGFGFVKRIRIECLIGNDVVLQKSLKVFLTVFTKEKAIDSGTKLLEGEVGRSKNCSSDMGRGVCNSG